MESMLTGLGEEGWEFINAIPEASRWGENNSGSTTEKSGFLKDQGKFIIYCNTISGNLLIL